MQDFYLTLVPLTATLLGIFLATIGAYFVFLQDRATQYSDKIKQVQFEIAEQLAHLREAWPFPPLGGYLPPEFGDKYRSKFPDKTNVELVVQAAFDLQFPHHLEMNDVLSELYRVDSLGGPLRGRVYHWMLEEFVGIITGSTVDVRSSLDDAFPLSATGPGFDQWLSSFDRLTDKFVFRWIANLRDSMTADFKKFVSRLNQPHTTFLDIQSKALDNFFASIASIKAKVNEIYKQRSLKEAYSFSHRVHFKWLLFWLLLSIRRPPTFE